MPIIRELSFSKVRNAASLAYSHHETLSASDVWQNIILEMLVRRQQTVGMLSGPFGVPISSQSRLMASPLTSPPSHVVVVKVTRGDAISNVTHGVKGLHPKRRCRFGSGSSPTAVDKGLCWDWKRGSGAMLVAINLVTVAFGGGFWV